MASLNELKAQQASEDQGATITIYQKGSQEPYTGKDGAPATVTVVGSESARFKEHRRKLIRSRSRNARPMTADETEMFVLQELAGAVIAWSGWEDEQGAPLPCTGDNVCKLLAWDHIYNQVNNAVHGPASFFGGGSQVS